METVSQLSMLLRKGKLDAVELIESVLTGIELCDDQAIFIDVLAERARAEARGARRRLKAGKPASLLDGIPIGWKDLFDIKGRVTTAASVVLKSDPPAKQDAALVAAANRAGMISVGTLNMTEFAYSGIGLNPHYGTDLRVVHLQLQVWSLPKDCCLLRSAPTPAAPFVFLPPSMVLSAIRVRPGTIQSTACFRCLAL
jgi:aspartyl-tRNA(Asn)/glutamyl-tRNA(Gln) amidotransferase subunit A